MGCRARFAAIAGAGTRKGFGGMKAQDRTFDREQLAWLRLKMIPDLGNRSILKLVRHLGSPSAVLEADEEALKKVPGLRNRAMDALRAQSKASPPIDEMKSLVDAGGRLLSILDVDYPANLKEIDDPPAVLFCLGALEPRDLVAIAVVGSRAASPLGIHFTERLCNDLAMSGVTVVSGFALGIDGAAHRGALNGGGRTVAVLGCGLDVQYPRQHVGMRSRIVEQGALVSEFPLGTPPAPAHFPQRNRIISGLSLGVVVVEAAQRSGSLITARFALEQGREVFAVPGMARHFRSVGPHSLLKQGAKLVENVEDILEEIRPLLRTAGVNQPCPHIPQELPDSSRELTPEEAAIVAVLGPNPAHIDEVVRGVGKPAFQVSALLVRLELRGVVRQLPGKYFVLDT
jgi:DNA processing protein